jgi:nucleotide-binding universal stress UspA family protein
MYQKILTPLDGSQRAEKILPYVEELAHKFGSQLILLQVVEPIVMPVSQYAGVPTYYAEDVERQMANAKNYLAGLQDEFHKKGIVEVQTFVESGPVVTCILNIAEQEQADLIAYASHGRTGLASVFYGSVAAGVLHQTDRPLLLIRSHN